MIQDLFHWWLAQMASLAPAGWRDAGVASQDCLVLSDEGTGFAAGVRRHGAVQTLGHFEPDPRAAAALTAAVDRLGARALPVVVAPPVTQSLCKTLFLPRAAQRNLGQALEFEMEHETPFRADDVVWHFRIRRHDSAHDRIEVELLLVPRYAIARACAFALAAGLRIAGVEVRDSQGRPARIGLLDHGAKEARGSRLVPVLAGAAAVLAVTAVVLPFARVGLAVTATRGEVARLKPVGDETMALQQEIDRLSQAQRHIAAERARVRDPLQVLAAATRALPDTTYLTDFSLRGDQATMVGLSPSAANLIAVLSAAPPFRDPAFSAPVLRPDGGKLELFTIKAQLDPTSQK